MSGFEIVGLIIGAIPVTIAALENYRTAHEMLRYFNNKSAYIDRLIQALEEQKFCLESEFDIVLRAAGFEQQDTSTIDVEYLQTILLRADIAKDLGRYLGRGYDPYRKALVRCEKSLKEIVRSIRGLVPASPSGDLKELLRANESKGGRYQFRKRIKFSLRKDELERRIIELTESTNSMRRLRETSASLYDNAPQSSSRTITKLAGSLQGIQRHAESLYEAIAQKLSCGCHHEHGTKFYLEGRSAVLQKGSLPIDFKLTIEAPETGMPERKPRYEICIEVLENDPAEPRTEELPEHSRVKFNIPEPPKTPGPPMTEIQNLCSSLDQARQDRKVLKVFLSPRGGLCSCHGPPKPSGDFYPGDDSYEMITLEQILLQNSEASPIRVKWNLIQRMNLSFNLASSLLQLYSTPWLTESWAKRNIYFRRLGSSSQAQNMVLAFEPDRPFLVHRFSGAPAARSSPYMMEAKQQLLDLGIMLLEIRHERSVESWALAHGFTLESSYGSRHDAASMWLRESFGELEPSYFDAAGRCIMCTFTTQSAIPCWEDLDLRRSICELVIKPLWSNCSIGGLVT